LHEVIIKTFSLFENLKYCRSWPVLYKNREK
jgi:hypothetical protein